MLARAARGQGFRSIAAASGVPEDTVRDRLRRFRTSAAGVREFFTRLAGALAVDPVSLDPAGGVLGDAVVAVAAAAAAAAGRWPALAVSGWELAAVVTAGSLLSRMSFSGRFAGTCSCLPWGDGSTRVPLCRVGCSLSLSTGLQGQAFEKGQDVTTADEADQRKRVERARETGLFRYSLVQELLEPGLSQAERGWRARELAGRAHEGPGGRRATVLYLTLTRWRRLYEAGVDALVPSPRQPAPRTPEEVLALAEALKRERPGRTAAQVRRILRQTAGWAPSDRTLQRLFERLELGRPAPAEEDRRAFGRFECARPNEMWIGDTLHGPAVGGKKSYLFAFIDDHSRAVMGARWSHHDDVVRMAAGFRAGPAGPRRSAGLLPR